VIHLALPHQLLNPAANAEHFASRESDIPSSLTQEQLEHLLMIFQFGNRGVSQEYRLPWSSAMPAAADVPVHILSGISGCTAKPCV
jgi:hypothetical protein